MALLDLELNYLDFPAKKNLPPQKIVRYRRNTKEFLKNSIAD
jgi:hypothetical protein